MQFLKLRLSGFKSFVEPCDFTIEPGLTGIVGPNGCGKSNLVEALRWVMGETRVKHMRGGEMEDVIFGGTDTRPARNVAEVSLLIDNADRKAPPPFNDSDELEVVRRIERGLGSNYLVQRREVRMRDVQLLFADAATGAHSPALVSQGRIGELIAAKPTGRRALLEEAAGIIGLHSRRHEAELKLRAAEANLARLDDVLITLDAQMQGLRKQARQAARYRNLSQLIRRAEAILLHLRWREAASALEAASLRLTEATAAVAERSRVAAAAATELADSEANLPALRQAEAAAAAEVARLTIAREQLDAEEVRVNAALTAIASRLAQLGADAGREEAQVADARAAVERLVAELERLVASEDGAAEALRETEAALEVAQGEVDTHEGELARLAEAVAAAEAERNSLAREIAEAQARSERQRSRLADMEAERARLAAAALGDAERAAAAERAAQAEAALAAARIEADAAATQRTAAEQEETRSRDLSRTAEAELARLSAEIAGLGAVLAQPTASGYPPVIDQVSAAPSYETALGAALGDDLDASLDAAAPMRWSLIESQEPAAELPAGVEPLALHVKAPPELARRIAQIGLVADAEAGAAMAASLRQGQRLVTRDGALWRWDGYAVAASATSAAATRLAQRNRMVELEAARAAVEAVAARARDDFAIAQDAARVAVARDVAARKALGDAMSQDAAARDVLAKMTSRAASEAERLAALAEQAGALAVDLAQDEARGRAAAERLSELPDPAATRARLQAVRAELAEHRGRYVGLRATHERLTREAEARRQRLAEVSREETAWTARADSAQRQIEVLAERRANTAAEHERLAARPGEIAVERSTLLERSAAAEDERNASAARLEAMEDTVADAERRLKAAEAAMMEAREERVRAEGGVDSSAQHEADVVAQIQERLECAPDQALSSSGVDPEDDLPELPQIQARLDRLLKERDTMGPVNLRAEQEAGELEQQIGTLQTEKADLVAAIARLRQGIGSLNREGRERLLAAFESVNRHFEELFVRLFGGGRAHLALVDAEDPLEAGLEVMASPPGKKLQTLSLLSGGEQTLTALSLLFAVFLTNPAPICVLDEVDAPLDDANVDRFCLLLDDIARSTGTRFMLVTHHRLTMARMDRLFGVTMAERGVSQLVSVDLQEAARMRATA